MHWLNGDLILDIKDSFGSNIFVSNIFVASVFVSNIFVAYNEAEV